MPTFTRSEINQSAPAIPAMLPHWFFGPLGTGIIVFILLLSPISEALRFSQVDSNLGSLLLLSRIPLSLMCIFFMASSLASFMFLILPGYRRAAKTMLFTSVLVLICAFTTINWTQSIRRSALLDITLRANPLIDAISGYEDYYHRPPARLRDLVPQFISAIPETGVSVCPAYDYSVAPCDSSSRWELTLSFPSDLCDTDYLQYAPTHEYRDDRTILMTKINNWAFFSEH